MPSIIVSEPVATRQLLEQNGPTVLREFIKQDLRVPLSSISNDNGDKISAKRDIIIFSDFDGTIFMQDTGHILFDNHGCGPQRREELDEEIKNGVRSFRDVSEEMWGSLNVPFGDGFEIMKSVLEIDPDFREFHEFCIDRNIPFNVISAGLKPVLRAVLDEFLGKKASRHIDIIANDASITPDGSQWKPIWLHDTPLGHDKAASIQEYRTTASSESVDGSCPLVVFVGDGVSDLAAAREADVLFARQGLRLEEYCIENRIPYIPFATFADIQREIRKIIRDDQRDTKGQGKPVQYNPKANFWRKVNKSKEINESDIVNVTAPCVAYTAAPTSVSLLP
ncbi:HAD-like protein [Terfezia boudieri ATCC MYA-4762]|uniref:HAD-like protein n=1 Tax=Terfezia boudieri ATCC MYA-4762 TaxID=1051890 RepID=A0A3N4LXB0_9PEZI|nr:HAD-like protein [Terfezia boudieri ATCC MYA-4762]